MFASGFRLWLKRRLPKLSNVDVKITNRSTRTSFEWAGLNSLFVSQIELTFGPVSYTHLTLPTKLEV